MSKFKIGDRVVVVNEGKGYTTYDTIFKHLGFRNIVWNDCIREGQVATVFGLAKHLNTGEELIAIEDSQGNQALIGRDGLRLSRLCEVKSIDKDQRIAELEDALKRCLNIWGREYKSTQGDVQTIGSQLYIKCNDLLKNK